MIEIIVTLMAAALAGLVAGILPGVGSSALMLAALPLLYSLPPELCIIYYAVAIQASQFSGSVSAINFGMMGELTSYPALAERRYVLENNLQKTALRFTALGSTIACIIPALMLYPMLSWFRDQHVIMRTDFTFGVTVVIIAFCTLYKSNPRWMNSLLVAAGVVISQVGMRSTGSSEREFLTFGQPFLYGGIPMIAVLAGLIAVPLIVQYMGWRDPVENVHMNDKIEPSVRYPIFSTLRGSVLGLFTGLLPAIGTQIGSNLAWFIEKKFYPKDDHRSVLARLTAAESANNGSQISVLIPLLVIGIAIVPSEMILLSILETKFWMPGKETWKVVGLNFYEWFIITLVSCSIFCYLTCYTFLSWINPWLKKNLDLLNKACILLLSIAVLYSGSLVEARVFFLMSFAVFSAIALAFRRVDFIPLVAGYFIGDIFIDSIVILQFLYS